MPEIVLTPPWLTIEVGVRYGAPGPESVINELCALSARLGTAVSTELEGVPVVVEPRSRAVDVIRAHKERVARAAKGFEPAPGHPHP